jgi:hypothetical protein
VPRSDRAAAPLRRRTIEAMKMLIARRISNNEVSAIGDAVILISDV